jgi:hypothetical protein
MRSTPPPAATRRRYSHAPDQALVNLRANVEFFAVMFPPNVAAGGNAPIVVGRYLGEVYCDGTVRRGLLRSRACVLIASCSHDTPHEPRGSEHLRDAVYVQTRAGSNAVTLFSMVFFSAVRAAMSRRRY